jgi:hypothetical protein
MRCKASSCMAEAHLQPSAAVEPCEGRRAAAARQQQRDYCTSGIRPAMSTWSRSMLVFLLALLLAPPTHTLRQWVLAPTPNGFHLLQSHSTPRKPTACSCKPANGTPAHRRMAATHLGAGVWQQRRITRPSCRPALLQQAHPHNSHAARTHGGACSRLNASNSRGCVTLPLHMHASPNEKRAERAERHQHPTQNVHGTPAERDVAATPNTDCTRARQRSVRWQLNHPSHACMKWIDSCAPRRCGRRPHAHDCITPGAAHAAPHTMLRQ